MQPDPGPAFWSALDELVAGSDLVIDRPQGAAHPRYPDLVYPLDYGFPEKHERATAARSTCGSAPTAVARSRLAR